MREIQQMVGDYVTDRPTMAENNKDIRRIGQLLVEETIEFLIELKKMDVEKMGPEMADMVFILCTIANNFGIDLETEVREKTARNMLKRPAYMYQKDGSYEHAQAEVLSEWTEMRESEFYSIPR